MLGTFIEEFKRLAHSWNTEVKVLGCYLRDVAAELFALKKLY
jgi:hypothetical protein